MNILSNERDVSEGILSHFANSQTSRKTLSQSLFNRSFYLIGLDWLRLALLVYLTVAR